MRGGRFDGYLNGTGEVYPGGNVQLFAPGQLGADIFFSDKELLNLGIVDTSATLTQLRNGWYKRVLSKAASTIQPVAGLAAFWDGSIDDLGNYIVTPDNNSGIVVGYYLGTVTKGYYCWIQTGGIVHRQFGVVTKGGTAAAGDIVSTVVATGKADVLADATAVTHANLQNVEGKALEAPTDNAIKKVWIPRRVII
jgi:hypothetical protein